MSRCVEYSIKILSIALLATLSVTVLAQETKEQHFARMSAIQVELAALKPLRGSSSEAGQQFSALQTELNQISASMAGDLPCNAGTSAQGSNALRAPAPSPTACIPTTTNFANTTPVTIPTGPGVVTSTINVSGADTYLWDVDVRTFITHTFNADLDITITSPAGTIVTLSTDNGAGNDNVFNGTVWDDSANPGGQVPYTNNNGLVTDHAYADQTLASPLVPEEALAAFIGEDPNGTWTITISDDLAGDGGSLDSWDLNLTTFSTPVFTMPVRSYVQNTDAVIPSGPDVVVSPLEVRGLFMPICKLELVTELLHSASGDLDVTLTSPAGTVVTLTTDNGDANDSVFSVTRWDDLANPAGQLPHTTNNGLVTDHVYLNATTATPLVAEESLGAFLGEMGNGIWTLTLSDDTAGDHGILNSWSINITPCSCESADLSVTLDDTPNPVSAGANLTYTLTTTNNGPNDALFVETSMRVPSGINLVSVDSSADGLCTVTSFVNCRWEGVTANGTSRSVTIVVAVGADRSNPILASFNATALTADPDPGNNHAGTTTNVISTSDLAITQVAVGVPEPLALGSAFSYNLNVSGSGPSDALFVMVRDFLPSTLSYVSSTCDATLVGRTLTWNVGTLPSGGSQNCTVNVTVAGYGPISNSAEVSGFRVFDPDNTNNSSFTTMAGVVAPADLTISLSTAITDDLPIGSQFIYRVSTLNNGPGNANDLQYTMNLSNNLRYDGNTCDATRSGNVLSWELSRLGNQVLIGCTVTVTAVLPGNIQSSVSVTTASEDSDTSNNTAVLSISTMSLPVQVPTLAQFSLYLLILLSLGLGLVAIRR